MATKWNNTTDAGVEGLSGLLAALEQETGPGEGKEPPVRLVWIGWKPGRTARAAAGFLAFFLGLSLILSSLCQTAGRLAYQADPEGWNQNDWQATAAFRATVADYLESFLIFGAGGELQWWSDVVVEEIEPEPGEWSGRGIPLWGTEASTASTDVSVDGPGNTPVKLKEPVADADADYQDDLNVLYCIGKDNTVLYSNTTAASVSNYDQLPEGYNFLLVFQGGTVTITKDGRALDVYGDGIYDEDSQWYVPGYENFQAGADVDGVTVRLAVRALPIQYFKGNYTDGYVVRSYRMYSLYQSIQNSQIFYRSQAIQFGAGLALLALYILLRRSKAEADRVLAKFTVHVWTEVRILMVCGCLLWLLTACYNSAMGWCLADWFDGWTYWSALLAGNILGLFLADTAAFLVTFWVVYLLVNDHRYNPKAARRSLLNLVTVRGRKGPFQKRLNRWNRAAALLMAVPLLMGLLLAFVLGDGWGDWTAWLVLGMPLLAAVVVWLALWRGSQAVRDVGRLTVQVETIRAGDLDRALDLPMDSDLRATAEQLNDIQAGMKRALAEQTRSERMKVELISNVSHDLKTPLTSILSYADLLRQEEGLPDHVRDYIRILDEKARRLSDMVQDVFEVSKAAADQLPVKLERLDLAKLLRQTLADMNEAIEISGLTFRICLPEEPVPIMADGNRLYRVFQNLLQNVLKYALPGSRVYLELTAGEGRAEASLRNISREELSAGVDFTARFVRGDESRTDGGSGLGLSIARSFTEACGGSFRIETVADLFTAVVDFPLAEELPERTAPQAEPEDTRS